MPDTADSPHVLLTGFEPFDQDTINPAEAVVQALDGWRHAGATVRGVSLPCVFGRAVEALDEAMARWRPRLVIGLGLAAGRSGLSLERVAVNIDDARVADNAGQQPVDTPVVPGGPAAYFATIPIKAIVHDLRAAGLPAAVSNTAGTFVCNHLFYALMHRLARQPAGPDPVRGGFIHLPALPEQAAQRADLPSMVLQTQVQALRVVIATALATDEDRREGGGHLH